MQAAHLGQPAAQHGGTLGDTDPPPDSPTTVGLRQGPMALPSLQGSHSQNGQTFSKALQAKGRKLPFGTAGSASQWRQRPMGEF